MLQCPISYPPQAVMDPSASTSAVSAAEKRFRVDRALSADSPQGSLMAGTPGSEALDWVLEGFSAAIIAFGQSGTGKTFSLFGPGGGPFAPDTPGLLPQMLWALFDRLERSREVRCRHVTFHPQTLKYVPLLPHPPHPPLPPLPLPPFVAAPLC